MCKKKTTKIYCRKFEWHINRYIVFFHWQQKQPKLFETVNRPKDIIDIFS